jgi:hypothetical protein
MISEVTQRFQEVALEAFITTFRKGDDQNDGGLECVSSATAGDDWKDRTAESGDREGLHHFKRRGNKDEPLRRENPRADSAGRCRDIAM